MPRIGQDPIYDHPALVRAAYGCARFGSCRAPSVVSKRGRFSALYHQLATPKTGILTALP